jgi:tetratricopeptide (TPR) repeat protein
VPPIQVILALAAVIFFQPGPAALRGIFEEGLERRRAQYGVFDVRTAQAARDLGIFLSRHGEEADARNVLDQVVRIDEKLFGAKDARTLADVAELAAVSPAAEAEALWKRASEATDAAVATHALAELGRCRALSNDREGAASLYWRAIAKEEEANGKSTAGLALDLNALAKVLGPQEAIPLLERAFAIDRRVLGAGHAETATTEANLAGLLADSPRNTEAISLASEALDVFRQTVGPDHPRTAIAASILAYAYEVKGDRSHAEQMYRLALSIDSRLYGPQNQRTLNDARILSEFLKTPPHTPSANGPR